jgi:hypothetical protein
VGKEEEVTMVRFVASDGWWSTGGRPAGGVQAGWPRCGSAPVVLRSGRGMVGAGRFGRPCGAVGLQQDRRHELEKGKLVGAAMARQQPAVQAGAVAAMRGAAQLLK